MSAALAVNCGLATVRERGFGRVVLSEESAVDEPAKAAARAYDGAEQDAALVARVLAGERGAFDELFRAHYARIYNFAVRLTGSPDSAEDIAQSAFVRVYESLRRLRDGKAFLKLMYRTVVNLVRDRAKSNRRKPWIGFADLWRSSRGDGEATSAEPGELADASLDPADIVTRQEFGRVLAQQIARLPLEFREVLVLHHIEGLDVRRIADIVGTPEGTVKSRLGRARHRLTMAMSSWLDAEG